MQEIENMNEMQDLPSFFIDQRLEQSADERTIKRAYAKALKQIDQENDLTGFQDLRESYEYALSWSRHRDWQAQQQQQQQQQQEHLNETVESAEQVAEPLLDSNSISPILVQTISQAVVHAVQEHRAQEQEQSTSIEQAVSPTNSVGAAENLENDVNQEAGHRGATLMSLSPENQVDVSTSNPQQEIALLSLDDDQTPADLHVSLTPDLPQVQNDETAVKVVVDDLPQLPAPIDLAKAVMEEVLQKIQWISSTKSQNEEKNQIVE